MPGEGLEQHSHSNKLQTCKTTENGGMQTCRPRSFTLVCTCTCTCICIRIRIRICRCVCISVGVCVYIYIWCSAARPPLPPPTPWYPPLPPLWFPVVPGGVGSPCPSPLWLCRLRPLLWLSAIAGWASGCSLGRDTVPLNSDLPRAPNR